MDRLQALKHEDHKIFVLWIPPVVESVLHMLPGNGEEFFVVVVEISKQEF